MAEARNEISHLPRHARALAEQRQRGRPAVARLFMTALLRHRPA